jgi:hypothetical protein
MGAYTDRLKGAKLPERSVPICLRGDLVADHEAAERDLELAQKKPNDSKEGSGVGALIERIEALQAEMSEHTDNFRLRALPRLKFRALFVAHPPRTDEDGEAHREDAILGVNRDTFFPALIRLSAFEPKLDDDDWRELFGDDEQTRARLKAEGKEDEIREGLLTARQFGNLEDAAWFLNRGEVDVPFSRAASLARRNTGTE